MQSSLDNFFRADNPSLSVEVIVIDDNEKVHEEMQEEDLEECEEDESAENDNMVCSSECCKLGRPGPNQPTSTSVLNATRRIQGEGRM